jgi:uncharacterized protein with HEPN domain
VVSLDELPPDLQSTIRIWAEEYTGIHEVAHWDESRQRQATDYDRSLDEAAERAVKLLGRAAVEIMPRFLELYPAVIWEDQDECLEVRPEDIEL